LLEVRFLQKIQPNNLWMHRPHALHPFVEFPSMSLRLRRSPFFGALHARFAWLCALSLVASFLVVASPSGEAKFAPAASAPAPAAAAQVSTSGLTPHFRNWLQANGYGGFNFARTDLAGGSYGGKQNDADAVVNQPVIFIHGNSDKAVGTGAIGQTGWNASIEYFLSRGYKPSEIYATTWGPANPLASPQQYHSRANLTYIRAFIQAVRQYTGAAKVDIVAHSMGVTLGRKAIKGGPASDALDGGSYNLGSSLTSSVDTFVGVAGGNRGLTSCYLSGPTTPTCGNTNGFYPGYLVGLLGPYGVSSFLTELNSAANYEGAYRYSIWSSVDEIVGYGCVVYGLNTCRIPGQTGEKSFASVPYGHFGVKDLTAYWQFQMVKNHSTN
jgi:triacylglycerol lipase